MHLVALKIFLLFRFVKTPPGNRATYNHEIWINNREYCYRVTGSDYPECIKLFQKSFACVISVFKDSLRRSKKKEKCNDRLGEQSKGIFIR